MEKSREIERLYSVYFESLHIVALKATAMQVLLTLLLDDLSDQSAARIADTVRKLRITCSQIHDVAASAHTNLDFRGLQFHNYDVLSSRVRLEYVMDTIKLALKSLRLDSKMDSYLPDASRTFTIYRELSSVMSNVPAQLLHTLDSPGTVGTGNGCNEGKGLPCLPQGVVGRGCHE